MATAKPSFRTPAFSKSGQGLGANIPQSDQLSQNLPLFLLALSLSSSIGESSPLWFQGHHEALGQSLARQSGFPGFGESTFTSGSSLLPGLIDRTGGGAIEEETGASPLHKKCTLHPLKKKRKWGQTAGGAHSKDRAGGRGW